MAMRKNVDRVPAFDVFENSPTIQNGFVWHAVNWTLGATKERSFVMRIEGDFSVADYDCEPNQRETD
jgi:hypothetical protein